MGGPGWLPCVGLHGEIVAVDSHVHDVGKSRALGPIDTVDRCAAGPYSLAAWDILVKNP